MSRKTIKKRNTLIDSPLPMKRAMTVTVLVFIALVIIGGLMIGGFFSRDSNGTAPFGGEDRRAKP